MLKLQFRDRRRESVWLVDKKFTIGKASDNSLMIDDPSILDHHAVILNQQDQLKVTNTAKSPKLLLNGKPVPIEAQLKANDVLSLGTVELELIDPKSAAESGSAGRTTNFSQGWSIYSSASWLDQNRYQLDKKVVIGRDPSCDITLPLEHLSRKHISLEVRNGSLFLKDLDSSNGTFVNGKQVDEAKLKSGDRIKLDVVTFEVNGPSQTHDPNKTIIRTAPANGKEKSGGSSRLSTKIEKIPSKKPSKPKAPKKRLASDGKQDWIAGDGQSLSEPKSKNGKFLFIGFAVVTIGLAIAATVIIL